MKITVEDILSKTPCVIWPEERLRRHIGEGKTLLQILNTKTKCKDRIWCVTRFLDDKTNQEFAIWCARQCKTNNEEIIYTIKKYCNSSKIPNMAADMAADWATNMATDWSAYWMVSKMAIRAARKKQVKKLKELLN